MNETTIKLVIQSLQQRVKKLKAEKDELLARIEELEQKDHSDIHKHLSAVATVIDSLDPVSDTDEAIVDELVKKKVGRSKKVETDGSIAITA